MYVTGQISIFYKHHRSSILLNIHRCSNIFASHCNVPWSLMLRVRCNNARGKKSRSFASCFKPATRVPQKSMQMEYRLIVYASLPSFLVPFRCYVFVRYNLWVQRQRRDAMYELSMLVKWKRKTQNEWSDLSGRRINMSRPWN